VRAGCAGAVTASELAGPQDGRGCAPRVPHRGQQSAWSAVWCAYKRPPERTPPPGMGRFGGLGSGRPEVARSEAHKASTSARTGAGGRMRPVWRRYTRKHSRASSRALNGGQRVARSAGSVHVVSTSSCLGESIMGPSLA
jgi:hypothetical protein